ncbi:hypothetical protein ACJ5NV_06145 [Loktanella agnita]|uniref:hypothetical protein n=1 Tax=Loktanella agnita TaxID=287097 RepID=UPI0039868D41
MTKKKDFSQRYGLQTVIRSVGEAMEELGQSVAGLEDSILDAALEEHGVEVSHTALQRFDLIIQSIEEIRLLLDRLSDDTSTTEKVDYARVIAPVKLEKIRNKISGYECTEMSEREQQQQIQERISLF